MRLPMRPAEMRMRKVDQTGRAAFSLVEVTIALGIVVIAILSVIGLLSVGIRSNRISVEETRASTLLTLLETDLRNTRAGSGTSSLYGLPLPYATNASGQVIFNPALVDGSFFSIGLTDAETATTVAASPRPRYQASVVYTRIPAADSLLPLEARLIVNWPATNTSNPSGLTGAGVSGWVDGLVTFPAP